MSAAMKRGIAGATDVARSRVGPVLVASVFLAACADSGVTPTSGVPSDTTSTTLTTTTEATAPTVSESTEPTSTTSVAVPPVAGSPQLQRVLAVSLDETGRASVTITDEGEGFAVTALADEGDVTGFEFRDAAGDLVPPLSVTPIDVFETPGSLVAEFPPGALGGELSVIGAPGAAVGLLVTVVSPVAAEVTAVPLDDGNVEITVTLAGPEPLATDQTVRAYIGGARDEPIEVPFAEHEPGLLIHRTVISPGAGEFQPLDMEISGTYTRVVSTGFVGPSD